MKVDEFKKKHGNLMSGFFTVGGVAQAPEIKVDLYKMIEEAIKELNEMYVPNTVYWVIHKKPGLLRRIQEAEVGINVAVICENEESLKEHLELFREVWVEAILEFGAGDQIPF